MATRSAIVAKVGKDKYIGVYCHNDGHPTHVGKVLVQHYNKLSLIKPLLALGDLSSLYENLTPPENSRHSFDTPVKGVVVSYLRDRGAGTGEPTQKGATAQEVADLICDYAYLYVYENGKWTVNGRGLKRVLKLSDPDENAFDWATQGLK